MVVQNQTQPPTITQTTTTSTQTPTPVQPTTSIQPTQPQKQKLRRKVTEVSQPSKHVMVADEDVIVEKVTKQSNDPLSAAEIISLKKRVKKLEKGKKSRTHKLKRLYNVGLSARIYSSKDEADLGDQEDASKQERKIADIDKDADISLVDGTQGRYGEDIMFDINDLAEEEVIAKSEAASKDVNLNEDEVTLAQTLQKMKSTTPRAKGVVIQEREQGISQRTQTSAQKSKDKGKAKLIEHEQPLKMKDQISFDEQEARRLQAEFNKEVRLEREKEEEEASNVVLIKEWDDVQAMMDADYKLATRLQAEEQGGLTVEEKSRLFVELMNERKKHFARLREKEQRRKPLTKAQKRNQMCTYLKNMAGFTHNQLKNKSFDEVQKAFDKTRSWIDSFVSMDSEVVEGSSKRAGDELRQESIKKQKIDDDKETAELQSLVNVIPDEEEVAVDAIPLATKPPVIVDNKIHKEEKTSYYQITRADGSSKMYKVFSQLLKIFDREDLETLWRLVKAKHGNTRPHKGYERVLWGDLKVMFGPHVEDVVWRDLREGKVLLWKLFDSCRVHFVRFQNLQVYMLVEKKYPLTPATITDMLNKKLQADHLNEISSLKLILLELMLLVYTLLLLVNAADTKLQLLKITTAAKLRLLQDNADEKITAVYTICMSHI
ncbi:hypothetical protein Tco_1127799 [Tanacetum coccineum]